MPVPEDTVRAAFRTAVDRVGIGVEDYDDDQDSSRTEDVEERADRIADGAVAAGLSVTLVPARARRIDERIARWIRATGQAWPPPEFAALDDNPAPTPLTASEATAAAVTTTLRGGAAVTPQGVGDLFRALQPGMYANPIASLAEYTLRDAPDAATVFRPDGGITTIPDGDARNTLRLLADTATLSDLRMVWGCAQALRNWALDLCERVEGELDAGQLGDAVTEWVDCYMRPSRLFLLDVLRDRRWSPNDHAHSALTWLPMRQAFRTTNEQIPGCQWHLLEEPGMFSPPLRPLLTF